MGDGGDLGAVELMFLGGVWTILVLGIVFPVACVYRADSRLIATVFGGQFPVCLGASGGLLLVAGALVGVWWSVDRSQTRPFDEFR